MPIIHHERIPICQNEKKEYNSNKKCLFRQTIKNLENLQRGVAASRRLATSQLVVKHERLNEKLAKQELQYDASDCFDAMTKSFTDTIKNHVTDPKLQQKHLRIS